MILVVIYFLNIRDGTSRLKWILYLFPEILIHNRNKINFTEGINQFYKKKKCIYFENLLILSFFFTFRDGQSRCGVYCAANACIEQVIQHGEVDVFQAVKTVRRHRPQLVENIVSFIYLLNFSHYSYI